MPNSTNFKKQVEANLFSFLSEDLRDSALRLLNTLGYISDKRTDFEPNTKEGFKSFLKENGAQIPNEAKAHLDEWQTIDFLFQLTNEEISQNKNLFDTNQIDVSDVRIESYLFFAIKLKKEGYKRSELAEITREINRAFPMPVMILFQHGSTLTFSIIDRRLHKRDESKDVLRKVTLIKDIRLENPHRAHIEILSDLALDNLEARNFVELHKSWQKVLDTKELNKKFFQELANWYFWAIENVAFPDDEEKNEEVRNATNVIRLITRLMFVWFLKEKGLVSEKLFDEKYLKTILRFQDESTFYKAILQNLFFATLNSEMNSRKFIAESHNGNNTQHFVHNVFRYKREFIKPEESIKELFEPIPFLNGGLFECLDKETEVDGTKCRVRVDGFSDNKKNGLYIPNELFFGTEGEFDLNEIYGTKNKHYKVRGLINILNSYKFTIAENTPIEEEIALDPELLGKVFENLLASYNPETQTTARKQTGSFYTPREIVNYMVDESLIAYLKAKLQTETEGFGGYVAFGENQATMFGNEMRIQPKFEMPVSNNRWHGKDEELEMALRDLFAYTEDKHQFNELETEILIKAIDNCKILDPACGSGAFPMGILHRLVHLLKKLDKDNEKWKQWQKQKAIEETKKAYDIGDSKDREDRLLEINDVFENNASDYGRKLFLIENCIYGVDIQPIAIQIAKLRFFISLIVDEKTNPEQDNLGIRPLPNLETKFVAANTLIGIKKDGLIPAGITDLEKELKEVRAKHFSARTRRTKEKYRQEDKRIRGEIASLLKAGKINDTTADLIADWNPYDQNAKADWFDAEYMFGIEKGFDIVIGNPPYIQMQKDNGQLAKLYAKENYQTFERMGDVYSLFYEQGNNLLKKRGTLCFITSNKWMRAGYGESTRKYFSEQTNPIQLIDFAGQKIFESATVDTNILLFSKDKNQKKALSCVIKEKVLNNLSVYFRQNASFSNFAKMDSWVILSPIEQRIKEKIERVGTPLKDWDIRINYGIKTGFNEAFIIDGAKRKELIKQDSKSEEIIRPILRGRDIKRYSYDFADKYLIATFPSLKIDIEEYPAVKRHLLSFGFNRLNQSGDKGARKKTNNKWFETQDSISYWEDFSKQKIVWGNLNLSASYAIADEGVFVNAPCPIIVPSNKFLLAVLNSKLADYYIRSLGVTRNGGYFEYKPMFIERLPVPTVSNSDEEKISALIDEIIKMKAKKQNTTEIENLIDKFIFQIYALDEAEIKLIDEVNENKK
jgi:adenine-specific DNA-methyltransferase